MATLKSLYGGGIAAEGIGKGLQGLVEGYRLKRELDNQQNYYDSMGMYRGAQAAGIGSRDALNEARIDKIQNEIDNPRNAGGRGGSGGPGDRAAMLTALGKTPYASDPDQMQAAYNALQAGQPLPKFMQRPAPPVAPAAPAGPNMLQRLLPSLFGGGAPAQAAPVPGAPSPLPSAPGAAQAMMPQGQVPVGGAPKNKTDWRAYLQQ